MTAEEIIHARYARLVSDLRCEQQKFASISYVGAQKNRYFFQGKAEGLEVALRWAEKALIDAERASALDAGTDCLSR